uniref:Uncharacterized protein n=1 Tax=Myotis myotis TaxID=51298 RepID=A0A7J7ZXN3_MYOMY|nr:hypothetical protein mMyoMyo1_009807 [Myotis myotis]
MAAPQLATSPLMYTTCSSGGFSGWQEQAAPAAAAPQMGAHCSQGCYSSDGGRGRVLLTLLLLIGWQQDARRTVPPHMGAGFLHDCCSSDGVGLLPQLLLFRWGRAPHGCYSSDWGSCSHGYCSSDKDRLLAQLVLLGLVQASHAAAAPQIMAGCSQGCSSSYGSRLLVGLLLFAWGWAPHSCCSSDGGRLPTGLPLLRWRRAAHVASAYVVWYPGLNYWAGQREVNFGAHRSSCPEWLESQ